MATPLNEASASRWKSSPYFVTSKRRNQCPPCSSHAQPSTGNGGSRSRHFAAGNGGSRSRHFAATSSPAVQSVMTMCSFVDALGGRRGTAISTFMSCSIFLERYNTSKRNVEHACRHLCSHGCFFWSYSPAREWHSLREAVRSISGTSPDRILDGWRCILAVNKASESEGPNFRVHFVSPSGNTFDNVAEVLKALNCSSGVRNVKSSRISATSRAAVRASTKSMKRKRSEAMGQTNLAILPPILPRQKSKGLFGTGNLRTVASCANDKAWSPFGLLEELFADDPWKLLLSTILLNRTTRRQVDSILYKFLELWPTAKDAANADVAEILQVVTPLGIKYRRSAGIIRFSKEYIELIRSKRSRHFAADAGDSESDPAFALEDNDVLNLHRCGRYALSAYRIFILGDLDCSVHDHALHYYTDYRRSIA